MDLKNNDIFKVFYQQNFKNIHNFCNSYLKDIEVSRDITQETFFRLYKNREKQYLEENARTWLYMVARNLCIDHLRHLKFQQEKITENIQNQMSGDFFLDQLTRQEVIHNIQIAVNGLTGQTHKITMLSIAGNSNQEIAELLNISVNSVKTLKKIAYRKLRESLKDELLITFLLGII